MMACAMKSRKRSTRSRKLLKQVWKKRRRIRLRLERLRQPLRKLLLLRCLRKRCPRTNRATLDAHPSRLSAAPSFGEEHAADHARDEIRGSGETATGAGRRVCGAAVRARNQARAAIGGGENGDAGAPAARAATRRADFGGGADRRPQLGGSVQHERTTPSHGVFPRALIGKNTRGGGG